MFNHYQQQRPKYQQTIEWTPPNWDPEGPQLKILVEKIGTQNARFVKASCSKKNVFPKMRRGESLTPKRLMQRREAMLNLAIMGAVAGWENVVDDKGVPVEFPKLSYEDPTAAGNKIVRSLFEALGFEATEDFVNFVNNDANWLEARADEDDEEDDDEEVVVPLGSKSPIG